MVSCPVGGTALRSLTMKEPPQRRSWYKKTDHLIMSGSKETDREKSVT